MVLGRRPAVALGERSAAAEDAHVGGAGRRAGFDVDGQRYVRDGVVVEQRRRLWILFVECRDQGAPPRRVDVDETLEDLALHLISQRLNRDDVLLPVVVPVEREALAVQRPDKWPCHDTETPEEP
jgi:hypothetical protein